MNHTTPEKNARTLKEEMTMPAGASLRSQITNIIFSNYYELPDDKDIVDEILTLITSTRLSAYKEGQRDMREEVVKMAEGMKKNEHGDSVVPAGNGLILDTWNEKKIHNQALTDLISEIGKSEMPIAKKEK